MIGIKDMTSQEIKELSSSRGKEIMEKIEKSKGTEEGILQDWLRASVLKELEPKINAYMDELKANPELYDFLKDTQFSLIPNEADSRTRIFEIKNEISVFLTGEEIKVLAFELMKIPILAHIKAQSISQKSYQAIAKTLDELYYCTEERTIKEIEQHFKKSLRDNSYVCNPWVIRTHLFIDLEELSGMCGGPINKYSFRCKLDVTRSGYYVLDKISEISLFVGRIANSMTTLYRGN